MRYFAHTNTSNMSTEDGQWLLLLMPLVAILDCGVKVCEALLTFLIGNPTLGGVPVEMFDREHGNSDFPIKLECTITRALESGAVSWCSFSQCSSFFSNIFWHSLEACSLKSYLQNSYFLIIPELHNHIRTSWISAGGWSTFHVKSINHVCFTMLTHDGSPSLRGCNVFTRWCKSVKGYACQFLSFSSPCVCIHLLPCFTKDCFSHPASI